MSSRLNIAIDLGTTNSAIAYGYVDGDNRLITQICKINRVGKEGGVEAKETVPSVVYFKYDSKTQEHKEIVGDFAKNQYGKKYGSVIKSVKNFMGNTTPVSLDTKIGDKKPEEISATILKHLLVGIKDKLSLPEIPKDVIITIPASFDSDQCNATLRAGELAGLNVRDENGNYKRSILLYEPKAVIYNVANMVSLGEIPKSIVDFSSKKNVMVFDLGGGTLDVALYEVYNNEKYNFPIIDELAVGRYTRIGGDDFDQLIAKDLVDRFLDYTGYSSNDVNIPELTQIMESRAEYLKLELSDKVFNSKFSGSKISDDEEFEISEMDIYKGAEFEAYLTKRDIEKILSPLMGNHLQKEDILKINSLTSEKDVNNIIYPILDVLAKARDNGYSTKVDAIILNGGMTKFYLIKDRIEKFFGVTPITVNDPDLAVAKGGAFYQYCLEKVGINNLQDEKEEKGVKVITKTPEKSTLLQLGTTIVNDDINLGLTKGYVRKLIKAGTKLPTGDIELEPFKIPVGTDKIELPIYLGRGTRTDFPNRKIANRVINLKKSYTPGTEVTLIVNVDENKLLTLSGYVGSNKEERIEVTIDTGNSTKSNEKSAKISANTYDNLNPAVEIETLRVNTEILETVKRQHRGTGPMHPQLKQKQSNAKFKISETVAAIKTCSNKEDFEKIVLEKLNSLDNSKVFKGILVELGANIYPHMSNQGKDIFLRACRGIVNVNAMGNNLNKDTITKAIIAIGETKDYCMISELEDLISDSFARNYIVNIVRTLGKLSADNDILAKKFLDLSLDNMEIDPYIYAIGKSFNRRVSGRNDKEVEKIVEKLVKILYLEKNNRDMALLAIGEICSTLDEVEYKLDEKFIEKIGKELSTYIRNCEDESRKERANLILNVIFGLKLTETEKEQWEGMMKK